MNSIDVPMGFALLMGGLLIEALIFRAIHADPPSKSKLDAVRDKLTRAVIEGKIDRDEPHFAAIYRNVIILSSGFHADDDVELSALPREPIPASLEPILWQLRGALEFIVDHHFGLNTLINAQRRESARTQKTRAKALLQMLPDKLANAAH
jgi:hypothetical protein